MFKINERKLIEFVHFSNRLILKQYRLRIWIFFGRSSNFNIDKYKMVLMYSSQNIRWNRRDDGKKKVFKINKFINVLMNLNGSKTKMNWFVNLNKIWRIQSYLFVFKMNFPRSGKYTHTHTGRWNRITKRWDKTNRSNRSAI